MLATVLKGKIAEQQSIFIMRAFREMRHYIKRNQQFATHAEMCLVTAKVSDINGHGRKGFLTTAVVSDFASQYPPLRIKSNPDCHDRWIVIDYSLPTEQVYHCGASSKDAGKKLCAINKIENVAMIHPVIGGLLSGADKTI